LQNFLSGPIFSLRWSFGLKSCVGTSLHTFSTALLATTKPIGEGGILNPIEGFETVSNHKGRKDKGEK
jgi:hypothetical protein